MRYLVVPVLLAAACSGRPAPDSSCPVDGDFACGAVGNNDRIVLLCARGKYTSLGTCQTEPCAETGATDFVTCDGVKKADQGAPCTGDARWACQTLGGKLLECGTNGRWIPAWTCGGETESCVANDGRFKLPDGGVPDVRCFGP